MNYGKFIEQLKKKGYSVKSEPYDVIDVCDSWYHNEIIDGFHKTKTIQGAEYEMERTNIAKRCCADDAALCEVIEINTEDEAANELITSVLDDNNFDVMFREQLEEASAVGTVGAYVRITNADIMDDGTARNGQLELNYASAANIFPLTVKNHEVIECAFGGEDITGGGKRYSLVMFTLAGDTYIATTMYFDKDWKKLDEYSITYQEGIKPFALLKTAGINNIKGMDGFGVPKIWNAVAYLKGVDLAWNTFIRDLESSEKLIVVNERLVKFDENGKPIKQTAKAKKLFVSLGSKLPNEKDLMLEYNPAIRTQQITEAMELNLSMLSMMFGYGTRKYSFQNGQILTATEYVGERQDMMQELNKQRQNVKRYIEELCKAIIGLYNSQNGTSFDTDTEILIDFDDSYITDKQSQLQAMREDIQALGLPALTVNYLMEKYNLTEEQAKAWAENRPVEDTDTEEV